MKRILSLFIVLFCFETIAQEKSLTIFDHLINKTWKAEGQWSNGSAFKQETTFQYGLDKNLVIVKSKGYMNEEQTKFGNRNFGIRSFNRESGRITFREYDIFGGVTDGEVYKKNGQLIYVYNYGGITLADVWNFVNDSTYSFKVGAFENDELSEVFLDTEFKQATVSADR